MPIGTTKNTLYGLALPILGKRCAWKVADCPPQHRAAALALHRNHAVGACVQRFRQGKLTDCVTVGYARLEPERVPVTADTVFRTASVAKMVSALLVFRLQTLGKLNVQEEARDFLGYEVRNPHCPDAPVTLGMLLSHTSCIVDSPAYFASFQQPTTLRELLNDPASYQDGVPGADFRYSNLAAGMVACLLEARFGESFEALAQRELFAPLGVRATFDASTLAGQPVADGYRVLPPARAFHAEARIAGAKPLTQPDPERHYLSAAGGLFITAPELAKLTLAAWSGRDGFLDERSLRQMRNPVAGWPEQAVRMRHGMGLLCLEDSSVYPRALWGHQGFAYGAVNGVFFDEQGNGFAALNSGVSERRIGHLAVINQALITAFQEQDA